MERFCIPRFSELSRLNYTKFDEDTDQSSMLQRMFHISDKLLRFKTRAL